jgi:hypothetical protein
MNYDKISVAGPEGDVKKIRHLEDFIAYREGDPSLIVHKRGSRKRARE